MLFEASIPSLIAAAIYALVAILAFRAGYVSRTEAQAKWHAIVWFFAAGLFALLIVWRVVALEDVIRAELREQLRSSQSYDGRREIQAIIAGLLLGITIIAAIWAFLKNRKRFRGRRNVIAGLVAVGSASMLFLVGLRLISLHAIDAFLYGPIKLNWFADLGIAAGTIVAAISYVVIVKRR